MTITFNRFVVGQSAGFLGWHLKEKYGRSAY
jgi:hypothetical protein